MLNRVGLISLLIVFSLCAGAQWKQPPQTGSRPEKLPDRTVIAGQSGLGPAFSAKLVEKDAHARQKRAVVEVHTDGVQLVDSAAHPQPRLGEAHIQYRLDDGEVINTTATRWQFDKLSRGEHRIQVALAGNDNRPIGEQATLKVHIP